LTDRRVFLRALALIFPSLPHLANAQGSARGVRVGYLTANPGMAADLIRSFLQGLRELGYDEGRNLTFERRYDELKTETFSAMAVELVRLNCDVIVVVGPEARLRAVRQATTTIPIVIIAIDYDPVARGYVASLARPGGNVTGLFVRQPELAGKRVDLLKAALPGVRRVAVLWDNFSADQLEETERVTHSLGLEFLPVELRNPPYDFASAFRTAERARAQALLSSASPLFYEQRVRIAELASRYRWPVVAPFRQFAEVGALLTFGVNLLEMNRYAATFVDKILKGARPADLPVEQPTKFELVINLKTARVLGLTIPQSVLLRADEVIQ
jgi:putative ABC transport system substrate-binding protein